MCHTSVSITFSLPRDLPGAEKIEVMLIQQKSEIPAHKFIALIYPKHTTSNLSAFQGSPVALSSMFWLTKATAVFHIIATKIMYSCSGSAHRQFLFISRLFWQPLCKLDLGQSLLIKSGSLQQLYLCFTKLADLQLADDALPQTPLRKIWVFADSQLG